MWGSQDKPRSASKARASTPLNEVTEVHAALAESEARSEERRIALEGHIQDIGFMRIQLRVRSSRITALEKEVSSLNEALAHRKERLGEPKSDAAALNDTIAALTAALAERDANIAALQALQLAEGESVAARHSDLARASAETEAPRKNLGSLEAALTAANSRLAEKEGVADAALERCKSLEDAMAEQRQQITRLDAELAGAVVRDRDAVAATEAQRKKLGSLEAALAAANSRLAEKESIALAALERRKATEAAMAEQRQKIARLEAELAGALRNRDAIAETNAQREKLGSLEAALAAANSRLAEKESMALAALERRKAMEAAMAEQRQKIVRLEAELAGALRNRDAIAETDAQREKLRSLEAALATANARIAEKGDIALAAIVRCKSLEAAIGEQRQQILRLEAQLADGLRDREADVAEAAALQAELLERDALLAAASARVLALEAEALDPGHASSALEEEPLESRARDPEISHAATDSTHRLEADRRKSARFDGPAKTYEESPDAGATPEWMPEDATPLFIRTGESEVVHVLGRKTTIGRTPENDVQIDAQYISRHHAVILAERTHTIIEDLNSTNGVIVNGRRVMRQALKDGDIVLIGKAPFRFAMRHGADRR